MNENLLESRLGRRETIEHYFVGLGRNLAAVTY